ncbi:hypothetical protein F5I97DRAFT_1809356 [Phlebopus sp. FC_14]|nr:hypothetical protein F5I97DRAFT_1809356 [Phlebopus sp. FC_14]
MARRPSVASLGSPLGLSDRSRSSSSATALSVLTPAAKLPHSTSQAPIVSSRPQDDTAVIDPDELFTKYTVAEVKAKQIQLRADAEAKQEELRIMVGERYRDLLQASTSIVSLATSAKRVQEVLHETVGAIQLQGRSPVQSRISHGGKEDVHLRTLQVLSAHVKLLLDAPEHLWRLIEREKYFQAAWLFLLARVVHRALIRDDAQDEESWMNQGIDVLEQFPLIQRQWETVSHFRTQIIHRATLSLRLHDKSREDICATLLTLHMLDSRPLADTLTIYLSQRTKTFNEILSRIPKLPPHSEIGTPTIQLNGHPPRLCEGDAKTTSKAAAFAVKTSTQGALELISQTLGTARQVFGGSPSVSPLAEQVLKNMQIGPSLPIEAGQNLPTELLLDTQTVLANLPSSTYFSLLPPNIWSYKPFVDLSSSSSSISQEVLRDKLGDWFDQSAVNFHGTLEKWVSSLDVVSGLWKIRSTLLRRMSGSGLQVAELSRLSDLVDEVIKKRIMAIWNSTLERTGILFTKELMSLTSDNIEGFTLLHNLYGTPQAIAPPLPGSGPPSFEIPFRRYKGTLTERLKGRTSRIEDTLRLVENTAASFRRDLVGMSAGDDNRRPCRGLVDEMTEAYRPEAALLCEKIVTALSQSAERISQNTETDGIERLVVSGRLAVELSTSSSFISDIGCEHAVVVDFRTKMKTLFEHILARWQEYTVSSVISNYAANVTAWRLYQDYTAPRPSTLLINCLHSLSSSIHSLGLIHYPSQLRNIALAVVSKFSSAFVRAIDEGLSSDAVQALYDLALMRRIAAIWQIAEAASLEKVMSKAQSQVSNAGLSEYDPDRSAKECLARTQTLISGLLPPISTAECADESGNKMATLLPYGVPAVDVQLVGAVELAQPSLRFPLLLVDTR